MIGSGFGGAVHVCPLAESGFAVLVLEHGRCWAPDDFPRGPDDAWIYDVDESEKPNTASVSQLMCISPFLMPVHALPLT